MSCPSWQWNRTGSYVWSPCGVTWDLSQPVMVIKLQLKPTYLSQSYLKIFIGYYFQSHWILKFPPKKKLKSFCQNIGLSTNIQWWDGFWPAGICFAVSFWGENSLFLFEQQKCCLKHSVTGKVRRTKAARLSDLCAANHVKRLSSHIYKNKKTGLMCEILIFCSPELSWSLQATQSYLSSLCPQW